MALPLDPALESIALSLHADLSAEATTLLRQRPLQWRDDNAGCDLRQFFDDDKGEQLSDEDIDIITQIGSLYTISWELASLRAQALQVHNLRASLRAFIGD